MTRLLLETGKIDDSAKRILTEGIVKYAQGFYMLTKKTGIDNYKENIGKLMDYSIKRIVEVNMLFSHQAYL